MEQKHHKDNDKKIIVIMVVNGTPIECDFALGRKLRSIVVETLGKTDNTGQQIENWDLRDEVGSLLDLDKHLREYNFQDKVKLFLNPKAGIGG
ncbi:MAG: hypothetical protein VR67_05500 [Peptococcaceae bacterium BRH_c8a]|nr:MAG: hypothetical protein VR67_05500 [Peptococcaceae bacterium BRH_c8a]